MLNVDYRGAISDDMPMSLLESAIGLIAPPQCIGCGVEGSALCSSCSTSGIVPFGERCAYCSSLSQYGRTCVHCRQPGTPRYAWVTTTHEGLGQQLVQVYKFRHLRAAGQPLAAMMAATVSGYVNPSQMQALDYLIVPLPTATSRIRQRGFDHSALLAKNLARKLGLAYCPALGRIGQSRQVGASRQIRLHQQSGNYFVRQPQRVAGRNILLIDDVITTGGSLMAAGKVLRAAGAKHVDALVFAKRL